MIPDFIHGCMAPVFTAFHADGRIDPDGQRAIFDSLLETQAVTTFFVRSGMGQMYTFDMDDTRLMTDLACGYLKGKAPVLVGTSGIWDRNPDKKPDPKVYVEQALELSKYAEQAGADGVVLTMPEAIEPGPGETPADVILRYFETMQAAVAVPVLIYQPPGTEERYCVTPELLVRIADMPNIKGMKVSSHDAEYIFDLTYAIRGRDFGYICGCETAFLAALVTGTRAVIGQGATVSPQVLKQVQVRYDAGDIAGAMEAQHDTNELVYKSRSTVEFYKRYINEKGFSVQPYGRSAGNPYIRDAAPLTESDYQAYKALLDGILAKL